jgi:radical SAM superfamily enzyme YgiQ (UPF0313 family)
LKISLVCVEDAISNIGFRKLAGYVNKELPYDTDIFYAAQGNNYRSYYNMVFGKWGEPPEHPDEAARRVAETVATGKDVVGFSSMSPYASFTKKIISHTRRINPDAFLVWGGIHPIVDPDDAIQHVDAICKGEGEFAFAEFLSRYEHGKDFTDVKNFWFNRDGEIIRNQQRPLMGGEELDELPLLQYGEDEMIYREGEGFVELTPDIYRSYNGLGYNAIWSIGCPLHCTFCANTKFIENNSNYTQIRHPSPSYLVDEIEQALDVHPFISSVIIQDDSLMSLHPDTLRALADEWKNRLDIPFTVMGVIPNYVTEEKMEILLDAGMNRLRMGIQNGSEEILDFYQRPAPPEKVREAADIINRYRKYMVPPTYDIIVDNPIEEKKHVEENIQLLRDLPDPYALNLFSLTTIPGTKLEEQLEQKDLSVCSISEATYSDLPATISNCLIYLIGTFPLPDWLYERLLARAKPAKNADRFHPAFMTLSRVLHFTKRGLYNLRFLKFSIIASSIGYALWWIGLLKPLRKYCTPDFSLEEDGNHRREPTQTRESVNVR